MLDKHITPDDHRECPECGSQTEVFGDRMEGDEKCTECDWCESWDNIPN